MFNSISFPLVFWIKQRSCPFMGRFDVFHPDAGVVNRVQFFHEASEVDAGVAKVVNR